MLPELVISANMEPLTLQQLSARIATKEQARALFEAYDHFIFDCDGVIWLDRELIPGVADFLLNLEQNGKSFAFVTNNSLTSRNGYLEKFVSLGIQGVTKDQIFPTCYAAAWVLKQTYKLPPKSKVWVFGDKGIEQELVEMGYVPVGGTDRRLNDAWNPEHELLEVDPEVRAIVVGSTKNVTYLAICSTLQYLLHDNRSLPFIGTNIDKTFPGAKGRTLPAGGSMVFMMGHVSDRDFVGVGKPSQVFLDMILDLTGFKREKAIMVGDTLYTDIKFGNDGRLGEGKSSLLVLSGGTTEADMAGEASDRSKVPSFYLESLGHLQTLLVETD